MKNCTTMPLQQNTIQGILFVNLATLLWASNIVVGRTLASAIGPLTLSAARFSLGGLWGSLRG